MSKKRYIDTHFWNDTWVADTLTRDERHFFLYLLTNDKTNVAGVYEMSLKAIAFEADFTRQEIMQMLHKMQSRVRYVEGWIVMRNGINNQNYKNEKIRRGIELVLEDCPPEALQYIDFPLDFKKPVVISNSQPRLMDESSMTHGSIYNSDSDSDSNISKPKGLLVKSDKPTTRMSTKQFFYELIKNLGFTEQVKATDGRIAKLKVRLNSFSTTDLLSAATNLAADNYMQGDNEGGKRYGTIDYLLRNDENVDKYLTMPTVAFNGLKGNTADYV